MSEKETQERGLDTVGSTETLSRPTSKTKVPSFYRVVLLNDDFTPMDFVIHILQKFFNKSKDMATQVMINVHKKGKGEAGVFTYEIAETKTYQVNQYARANRYPLKCTLEKA